MKFYQNWTAKGNDGFEFPARVPGNLQADYAAARGWGDIQYADTVYRFEEIEDWAWTYQTVLNFTADNERVFFVAEGIDYQFDIRLDGKTIFSQEGMYTPVELDLTDTAQPGSVLEVFIYPRPWREGAEVRPHFSRTAADASCKPPVTYGWDWNPQLVNLGIWQDAYIETRKNDFIDSCEPFYTLAEDFSKAQVHFDTVCAGEVTYTVTDPDGHCVYCGKEPQFTVENPRLWWCNGQGEAALYEWTVESGSDKKSGAIGFRTVKLVRNTGADIGPIFPKSRYPAPITVELNGRRIFAKGSNYVNPELFFGQITEKTYADQIALAKQANMNMFRAWGGAGICKKYFYELCDRAGILVWQEFMLACNNYVGTPHYLKILEQEATSIIKQLRRYPCLAFWCGGNELFNSWSGMDEQSMALRLLNKLCYDLDPERPFMMTAPLEGMAHGSYTFICPPDNKDVFERFNGSKCTAYSEFGVPSLSPAESLRRVIPEDEVFPIVETSAWVAHHGFHAFIGDTWTCNSVYDHYYGPATTLEERVEQSNRIQSVGYQAIFEEARRQWPYCSMALNWCFNEPWITAGNNSLVAYPNIPKPALFTVANSLSGQVPSARIPKFHWDAGETFSAQLWYLNDLPQTAQDEVTVTLTVNGETHNLLTWQTNEVSANENKLGPSVNFVLPKESTDRDLILTLTGSSGRKNSYILHFTGKIRKKSSLLMNQ